MMGERTSRILTCRDLRQVDQGLDALVPGCNGDVGGRLDESVALQRVAEEDPVDIFHRITN